MITTVGADGIKLCPASLTEFGALSILMLTFWTLHRILQKASSEDGCQVVVDGGLFLSGQFR